MEKFPPRSLFFAYSGKSYFHAMKILVLRRHNHVGDMLCSLPLFAAIRRRWPSARISLLATPTRYPVPILDLNPYLDELSYYRKGSVREVFHAQKELRMRRFDVAFVPSTVGVSRTSHLTARLTGAPLRVGVRSIDGVINPSRHMLTEAVDMTWVSDQVHQMDRNLQIAEAAGCTLQRNELEKLSLDETDQGRAQAERFLARFEEGLALIGVHPGAGKPQNVWPTERFAAVLRTLYARHHFGVVITSGALDARQVHALAFELGEADIPFHVLDSAPVPMLSSVMRRLKLYLCNDTGTMHIAAFSGCRTVSLFGPTHAWEWAPRGQRHRVVESETGEMDAIPAAEVEDASLDLLDCE